MSTQNTVDQTPNQLHVTKDTTKIFVWNPRSEVRDYDNDSGDDIELKAGTVFGVISGTNILLPLESDAIDGSQFPVGVLMHDVDVADGASAQLTIAIAGDVDEDKLIFINGTDTLATAVSGRTLRDRIKSDTAGIILVSGDQLTAYDNS